MPLKQGGTYVYSKTSGECGRIERPHGTSINFPEFGDTGKEDALVSITWGI